MSLHLKCYGCHHHELTTQPEFSHRLCTAFFTHNHALIHSSITSTYIIDSQTVWCQQFGSGDIREEKDKNDRTRQYNSC